MVNQNKPGLSLSTTSPQTFASFGYTDIPVNPSAGATGATYEFGLALGNPVPISGYLTVTVPSSVRVSSSSTITCMAGCNTTGIAEVDYDDATSTFTVTNAFFDNGYQDFLAPLVVCVTDLTSPNDYSTNLFTIATYDDQYNAFPIDQEAIGISPIGLLTFSKAKKRNFSTKNYIFKFTADRTIPSDAMFVIILSGDFIVPEQDECLIKTKPVDFGCTFDVGNNMFILKQNSEEPVDILVGEEVQFIIGEI